MAAQAALLHRAIELEERPARWRIGLIALATDHTSERDFAAMRPSADLAIYVNRVAFANPTTEDNLLAMRPRLTAAAGLILPDELLDAIAYSCTAASALIGDDEVRDAIQAAKPGVPVVTPSAAAAEAFVALGATSVSVLTPYTKSVTEGVVRYFEEKGLRVLSAHCFGLTDDREIARVSPTAIDNAACAACHPDAEALFISCTALRAVAVLQTIEGRLHLPVVTSNQAMFWQTIRKAGCDDPLSGFGRLLQMH